MVRNYHNYDKYPAKKIEGFSAIEGYEAIVGVLKQAVDGREHTVITIETYTQVDQDEITEGISGLNATFFDAEKCMVSDREYMDYIRQYLTNDRVFGIMNTLKVEDFYVEERVKEMRRKIEETDGICVVYGVCNACRTRTGCTPSADAPAKRGSARPSCQESQSGSGTRPQSAHVPGFQGAAPGGKIRHPRTGLQRALPQTA